MDLREVVSVNIERDERGRGLLIRVALPDADEAADLRGQLAVMERRALDAERAALDAGKANADAIRAAVRDEMARLAAEFASRGDAVYGDERSARADVFHICAERCRELAK